MQWEVFRIRCINRWNFLAQCKGSRAMWGSVFLFIWGKRNRAFFGIAVNISSKKKNANLGAFYQSSKRMQWITMEITMTFVHTDWHIFTVFIWLMNIVFHEVETRDWLVDILFWPGYIFISCKESILPPCNHHRLTAFFMLIAQNKRLFSDKKWSIPPHNSISLRLRKNRLLCFIRVFPALLQLAFPLVAHWK